MRFSDFILTVILFFVAVVLGVATGLAFAFTQNIKNSEEFIEFDTALPTRLLDINGELITEFASDEKREIIQIGVLPQNMIDALVTREDKIFYKHHGFSIKAVFRAAIGLVLHKSMGGGSTLTQQIAGTLYCDRREMSIKRKCKELWWAIQMERRYSKAEILEKYLNMVYFGGGTYGVGAAARYYFGHGAANLTSAEAALLVIQLSNPAYYNPFDYPNRAMARQKDVLHGMVQGGYLTQAQADESFDEYWASFDYTRTNSGVYYAREDKAPWFSEYVRRELTSMLYGAEDIYTSGLTVYTTLDLRQQRAADTVMQKYITQANTLYKRSAASSQNAAFSTYIPMSEMLSLLFDLPAIKVSGQRAKNHAMASYENNINPVIDIMSLLCGIDELKVGIVNHSNELVKKKLERKVIEGTMVCIDNDTGYITALVGGSKFDAENQFIRAMQARVQPGSTFKPLYYSAAIDSRKFTATTPISDTPVVFYTADGKPYIPQNFRGEWEGDVELWYALAHSMNVPSLKVLDAIGFDAAIQRAVSLLGINDEELPKRGFVPGYPIGLGVCSVRPIEMAKAFATFANGGYDVIPMAIRYVEDSKGNVILNPEAELTKKIKSKTRTQVISEQTAYIMTQLLKNTVQLGTLAWGASNASSSRTKTGSKFTYTDKNGNRFTMSAAGKTGTTQNWADAWTVGFTPYYTSAFWFGFDKPGQSLGLSITGSTLAGVAWGDFMKEANSGLPQKDFAKPEEGVIQSSACSVTGLIPTVACSNHIVQAWYLSGTEPSRVCEFHSNPTGTSVAVSRLQKEAYQAGYAVNKNIDNTPLDINLDFLDDSEQDYDYNSNIFNNIDTDKQNTNTINGNYLLD